MIKNNCSKTLKKLLYLETSNLIENCIKIIGWPRQWLLMLFILNCVHKRQIYYQYETWKFFNIQLSKPSRYFYEQSKCIVSVNVT